LFFHNIYTYYAILASIPRDSLEVLLGSVIRLRAKDLKRQFMDLFKIHSLDGLQKDIKNKNKE
jgi:hypothetical protein